MNPFPIQAAKVQAPVLREETLARDRLLEWLDAKIHHRLVLVIAEAGYGKTTLLADFTRRTRLRTIWYRLDETDVDWVTVLHHLVAAGRQTDPSFGSATWSLLGELGTGGTPMATILATFIRELQAIGDQGTVLILDDYHVVESTPELQHIVREIVNRAPERLSVVILSRRVPILPIARLRALGEVAEIGRDALRFEATETERLFRETYRRPLEPDVLAELDRRTEGWAASLQLVRSALRQRSTAETRAFVSSLSGARGTLHDFLAEEVVGDLDPALQSFLMRTSILSNLSVDTASIAADVSADETRDHVESAARIGLLPQTGDAGDQRYHPLVREFLDDRLRREVGGQGVTDLHRVVARYGERTDWKLAAHHYEAAGDLEDLHRVLVGSMQDIMGSGGFALAESYVRRYPELEADPTFGLFLSRRDAYNGDFASALDRAQAAVAAHPSSTGTDLSHLALANLATISFESGDFQRAVRLGAELEALDPEPGLKAIAQATADFAGATIDRDLLQLSADLESALVLQEARGHLHYCGVTRLNLAYYELQQGRAASASANASAALELLSASSAGPEISTLLITRAHAQFLLGDQQAGRSTLAQARDLRGADEALALLEAADLESAFGDPVAAQRLLGEPLLRSIRPAEHPLMQLVGADLASRASDYEAASKLLARVDPTVPTNIACFAGRWHLMSARVAIRRGADPSESLALAHSTLARQQAHHWLACVEVLSAVATSDVRNMNERIESALSPGSVYLTICADDVATRLGDLDDSVKSRLHEQAREWPLRWRPVLRRVLAGQEPKSALVAGAILDEIGEPEDVHRLRTFAKAAPRHYRTQLGRGLARRLAPRAHFHDMGHVTIDLGGRSIDGSDIRRKVLSLVCFLLTKPGFTATRDQVLEALWPDLEPAVAVNSLNQTVYFLRRVFEDPYREDESANYVHHDGEVVRLDAALATSQSGTCRSLAERARLSLDQDLTDQLSVAYCGRFAVDFEYEDWASPYRETLHAAYLDVVEQAIRAETAAGRFEHASSLARRALDVDPEASSIEHALLSVYRITGSHAAAAEQLSHYAAESDGEGPETPS